jgi:uncharacterized SAM-binding protein YcdF (DUF218 family)
MEWDLFTARRLVDELLHPLQSWLLASGVGIGLCVWRPWRYTGTLVLLCATVWLAIASLPVTSSWLLETLEATAGPHPDPAELRRRGVTCVVVMGNLDEGVALWKSMPEAKLVLSSGSLTDSFACTARKAGVPENVLLLESTGRNTEEQARNLKPLVGNEPFAVCTWALHMPRTLLSFRQVGLEPIPAPTDFVSTSLSSLPRLRPSLAAMNSTKLVLHEYLGMLWLLLQSVMKTCV